MFETMPEMCKDCPFGSSKAQRHMRKTLRPGRFNAICQEVWQGAWFACHKTTQFRDGDDEDYTPGPQEKQCRGAVEFVQRATENRRARSQGA
jgi:hypothetical protein